MSGLDREIHVYSLNVAHFLYDYSRCFWSLLADDERERASRIKHQETQQCFVLVRSCLRSLLGRYLSCDARSIRFALGEKGKPRLAGLEPDRGLVFNVSHTGNFGLIAFASDTALGVDVERRRPMTDMDGIAERCFSAGELAHWRALPPDRCLQAFFDYWCFKEAFVKATGQGITLGLESCVVDLSRQPRMDLIPNSYGNPDEWQVAEIDAFADHSAGICYRGAERKLRHFDEEALVNILFTDVTHRGPE
ncbi:MAG: 4-phosphopantetheinyl transferase [Candidatus Methylumidiphilus alinenensis]|uniref:4-phosphopantetheinyl transferase n=1 Tax=Candidatus Methylumidiphilus alinenensis TaxID=2202197 RepID=A0A2W4QM98_9GAMM|nr:MAG: 4-phosphopantetheinyl transferase [Candidatus Methylumidiphilus alinenensis]